ncbi:heavy-metal-associated domain-containing protein [Cupriavidus consociatus]|uniref:heavy-metal-associated domain-containing protein n=1 Tax=Cupriavidus consociatus TaxID=2821357 RepID=UPI001AEB6F85|nr:MULTISPECIES: heavy-metal-associated domain-containing protein [unclassified Cupriavidus]MBP0623350.1 heavy-metal-associated domain-containing protein [Cupriavidus sp. LEh25]MDK2660048.1 heavy-metal-associated domain-containing protein [Cupriavidus sp. LEh21]
MITFEVKGITCGHCVSTITRALKFVDDNADFTIDQARQLIMIESTDADPKVLQDVSTSWLHAVRVEHGMVKASAEAKSCCDSKH